MSCCKLLTRLVENQITYARSCFGFNFTISRKYYDENNTLEQLLECGICPVIRLAVEVSVLCSQGKHEAGVSLFDLHNRHFSEDKQMALDVNNVYYLASNAYSRADIC